MNRNSTFTSRRCSFFLCSFLILLLRWLPSQVWVLLHGGGPCPSRHLQCHPHHLPAQTGRTLFLGLCQHVTSQGLPAPVRKDGDQQRFCGPPLELDFGPAPTSCEDEGRRTSAWNKSCQLCTLSPRTHQSSQTHARKTGSGPNSWSGFWTTVFKGGATLLCGGNCNSAYKRRCSWWFPGESLSSEGGYFSGAEKQVSR